VKAILATDVLATIFAVAGSPEWFSPELEVSSRIRTGVHHKAGLEFHLEWVLLLGILSNVIQSSGIIEQAVEVENLRLDQNDFQADYWYCIPFGVF